MSTFPLKILAKFTLDVNDISVLKKSSSQVLIFYFNVFSYSFTRTTFLCF